MPSLLIVDDDATFRESLQRPLQSTYELRFAASQAQALEALESPPDAILLDLHLSGSDRREGLEVLRVVRLRMPHIPVVVVTGQADVEVAVECMSAGASSFLQKRPGLLGELQLRLREALERSLQTFRQEQLEREFRIIEPREIVGTSAEMDEVRALVKQFAEFDVDPIFIQGETGTGKELIARAIHANNPKRCDPKPFIPVNLSEGSSDLVADNLFGHVKGGFTDAHEPRAGFLEQVRGGVLFLDEIAEVDPNLQVKLLRVLQERVFKRLGSNTELSFDAQIVIATNADIQGRLREGQLREDFVGRLMKQAVSIVVPPLRERKGDVPLLTAHFITSYQKRGWKIGGVSQAAMELLCAYSWPFNIRELEGVLKDATLRALRRGAKHVEPQDLGPDLRALSPLDARSAGLSVVARAPAATAIEAVADDQLDDQIDISDDFQIGYHMARQELLIIREAIKRCGGKDKAAQQLGYEGKEPRSKMFNRIKQHGKNFPALAEEFADLSKKS